MESELPDVTPMLWDLNNQKYPEITRNNQRDLKATLHTGILSNPPVFPPKSDYSYPGIYIDDNQIVGRQGATHSM